MLEEEAGEGAGGVEEGMVVDEGQTLLAEEGVGVSSVADGVEEEMGGEDFGDDAEQDAGMEDEEEVAIGDDA